MKAGAPFLFLAFSFVTLPAQTLSPLTARGYAVLPEPQVVRLAAADFRFGPDWSVQLSGVNANDIPVQTLAEELATRFGVRLTNRSRSVLRLVIAPNSARVGETQDRDKQVLAQQSYKISLAPGAVTISANAGQGLFYGVETFLQLLKPAQGSLWLPGGEIEDWPDLQLRQIYWDDAHHLDRPEALKKAIRQAAFFKINGFALKLEGHFQYKSAPALVEPQALAPAEYQELTSYGLRYYVQLIPYLDSPAHIAFILKHPEYARLRAFPESNYELCVTNPDSYRLIFGMFQDLLNANKGVKYFYLSTDEPYYIGLANNSQCQEAPRAKELGSVGKLLAEFVSKAAGYLHERGRTVVFWGEYPLKPDDIASLPSHLVNGEVYGPQFDPIFRKRGIREMIYTSTEGEEKLFPEYFPLPESKRLHPGRPPARRVADTFRKISFDSARRDADLMGMINAGWADMGLHASTFWLGYATAAATGWHPGSPDPAESMSAFYPLYYGWGVCDMNRLYQLMSTQAQFWSDSWDTVESQARKPIWGNSNQIFQKPRPARDQSLPLPPAPSADLTYDSKWSQENARRLELASEFMRANDELLGLLHENLRKAHLNRYDLEVFTSIAHLYRQNLEMLEGLRGMDNLLRNAADAARKNQPRQAVRAADRSLQLAKTIQWSRNKVYHHTVETWYKTWLPRVAEANGRRFLHELDDVKDHLPDRTVDMSYLIYRQLLLPFGEWVEAIRTARNHYAQAHGLPARTDKFDWKDLRPVSGSETGEISLE